MRKINILFTVLALIFISLIIYQGWVYNYMSLDEDYEWAFGEDWATMSPKEHAEIWNERHKDIFVVYGTDRISVFYAKVFDAYWTYEMKKSKITNIADPKSEDDLDFKAYPEGIIL